MFLVIVQKIAAVCDGSRKFLSSEFQNIGPATEKARRPYVEIWVIGRSRSLKTVPFESLGAVSYSHSVATMWRYDQIFSRFNTRHERDRHPATQPGTALQHQRSVHSLKIADHVLNVV